MAFDCVREEEIISIRWMEQIERDREERDGGREKRLKLDYNAQNMEKCTIKDGQLGEGAIERLMHSN